VRTRGLLGPAFDTHCTLTIVVSSIAAIRSIELIASTTAICKRKRCIHLSAGLRPWAKRAEGQQVGRLAAGTKFRQAAASRSTTRECKTSVDLACEAVQFALHGEYSPDTSLHTWGNAECGPLSRLRVFLGHLHLHHLQEP